MLNNYFILLLAIVHCQFNELTFVFNVMKVMKMFNAKDYLDDER